MKKQIYKTGILLFISLSVLTLAVSAEEVSKEYHKEYKAGANTALGISNKYGDIVIQSWNQNDVVIDVKVTVNYPSKEKAERYLGLINVEFAETADQITAKTVIDEDFNFSGWSSSSRNFSIDYTIKMPVAMALALSNRYGDTDINELTGALDLEIKYGDLTAGKLLRGNVKPLNKLNLAYGKATIGEAGWFDLYLRYVGMFEVTKSQALLLDSRYSKLNLGSTSSVVGESKYDNIRIDNINNLDAEIGYTNIKIGELSKKLNYSGSYGSFTVERIPAGFESIAVDTRYMGVKLGIDDGASYRLEAKVSYGGINYNQANFNNERRIDQNTSKEVSGVMGTNGSPSATVNVKASYGTVSLN